MAILSLTFDDGNESQVRDLYPVLKRNRLPATFYVVTSQIGQSGKLTPRGLDTLAQEKNEIGSHGHTHRSLPKLGLIELRDELEKSKETLTAFGVRSFSYPFGHLDDRIVEEVARHYDSGRAYSTDVIANRRDHLTRYVLRSFPIEGRFQTRIQPGARDFIFSRDSSRSDAWFIITMHGQVSVNFSRIASKFRRSNLKKEQLASNLGYIRGRLSVRQQDFLPNFERFCSFLDDNDDTITVTTVSGALEQFQ